MITKVNICGIPHTVRYVEDVFDIDTHLGQILYSKGEIRINRAMPEEIIKETICHEMVHGIFVHLGYDDLAGNEQLVQALGNAICQGFEIKSLVGEVRANK